MTPHPKVPLDEHTLQRIRGEYLEMPGLRLTVRQAQRLWGLDEETCVRSLERLVETRFLARAQGGSYVRLGEGAVIPPTLRMAKATVKPSSIPARETRAS
jgi:hypothetical protein